MSIIIGIDIGGSTTKITGYRDDTLLSPLQVQANDPVTSAYGAFGKFISFNGISLPEVTKVVITGVGSSFVKDGIYGIPTFKVDEFVAIGLGGLAISGLDDAIIVSMGTGTSFVRAHGTNINHLGGTGVGGGTLLGLSSKMLNIRKFEDIVELARGGNLRNVDLYISDISNTIVSETLDMHITASNFGKLRDTASNADIALGIINMVFQTIAMLALFASKSNGTNDVVLIGTLTTVMQAGEIFSQLSEMFNVNFLIPTDAIYATATGAALTHSKSIGGGRRL